MSTTTPDRVPERFRYRHYGLTLEVNEPIPRLAAASRGVVDFKVEVLPPGVPAEADRPWKPVSGAIWRSEAADGSWLRVRYRHDGAWAEFVMDGRGDHVWVSRSEGVAINDLAELLLGPMFSCLASQRGFTCIHGAVLRVQDRVVAVAGSSGAGKSTTALGLVKWGEGVLISDDVAVLSERGGRIVVATGTPRLRMREAPAMALLGDFGSLEPVWDVEHPDPKRYMGVEGGDGSPVEDFLGLDGVYFLMPWSDQVSAPSIRTLTPGEALPRLMAQRHVVEAVGSGAHRRDFELLANLVRTASVKELNRPSGLETTERSVAAIIADVRSLA